MVLSEKKEWNAIDCCKFICSLMVVAIHFPLFQDFNEILSMYITNVFCRLAVPFFFIAAGFFVTTKINNIRSCKKYIIRLLILYVLYSIIYIPQAYKLGWLKELKRYIRRSILVRSYIHLWFFVALIFAIILLYFCVNVIKISDLQLGIILGILYAIGVAGNTYSTVIPKVIQDNIFIQNYYRYFETTRNGLFFAFPFVSIGYLIRKNGHIIHEHNYIKWTIIGVFGMVLETTIGIKKTGNGPRDMIFMLLPTAICLFLAVSFYSMEEGEKIKFYNIRKLSTLIFAWQFVCGYYLEKYCSKMHVTINSMEKYILIVIILILGSEGILKLSGYKYFKWLKYLY